jgi:hypothetical protein
MDLNGRMGENNKQNNFRRPLDRTRVKFRNSNSRSTSSKNRDAKFKRKDKN